MAGLGTPSTESLVRKIMDGVAADGTPGDELLLKIRAINFWPLNAFGIKNLSGVGCRFKVKGTLFSGDIAVRDAGNLYEVYCGRVRKKYFNVKKVYDAVPGPQLAAVLSAITEDKDATVVYP